MTQQPMQQQGRPAQQSQQPIQMGQQPQRGMQGQQMQTAMGLRFADATTQEQQIALSEILEAIKVCEWCADQCLDEGPAMAECIRRCRDVTDIGSATVQLMSRHSIVADEAANMFINAASACLQECSTHHHAHCQDCAEKLDRAIMAVQQCTQMGPQ